MSEVKNDRYVSFDGISCDENADRLIATLEQHLEAQQGREQWQRYFYVKRQEQQKMARDNLHFIGNQLNALYEYFEECGDQGALDLLYKVEQECC